MTVVVEDTETQVQTTAATPESSQNSLAPWHIRAAAFAIDVLPPVAVVATMVLVSLTVPPRGAWWWVCLCAAGVVFLLMLVNRLMLPTITGWSLGRAFCGIEVVRRDGSAPEVWGLLVRDLAHLLDTASLMVGWLWPLGDSRHRTFADILLRTEVRRVDPAERLPEIRRWTAATVLTAAGLCLAGAAVSFFVVYSRERATDEARSQVGTEGPKIVAQMLTYDPNSLHDDFARARSLATDKYRGQLAAQQEAVEKGHPVINEYRVTDSAIQAATPDHVTMLVFMDGRRGAGPDERYITATVRVTFAKGRDARWRVDELTVVTKPKPPGNGK